MRIVDKNPVVITKKPSTGKQSSYYTLHICLLYKSKTIWMFYKGDNPVDKTNIYNVQEENRLFPGLQPLTASPVP